MSVEITWGHVEVELKQHMACIAKDVSELRERVRQLQETLQDSLLMLAPSGSQQSESCLPQSSLEPSQQGKRNSGTPEEQLEEKVAQIVKKILSASEQSSLWQSQQFEIALNDLQERMLVCEAAPLGTTHFQERIAECEHKLLSAGTSEEASYNVKADSLSCGNPNSNDSITGDTPLSHEASIDSAGMGSEDLEIDLGQLMLRVQECEELCRHTTSELIVNPKATMTRAQVKAFGKSASGHKIQATVWEISIVAGLDVFRTGTSVLLVIAFIFNAVLQALITAVLFTTFTESRLDSVDIWEVYRYTIAHDKTNVNPLTGETLASRVCRSDASLGEYIHVTHMLHEFQAYLDPMMIFRHSGQVLCWAVLLIWIFQCTKEVVFGWSFLMGVLSLPTSETKLRDLAFHSISRRRKIFVCIITIGRLVNCGAVLITGCLWLSTTYDMEALVIDALALSFVLDLDELCFQILVPMEMHAIQEALQPLHKVRGYGFCGVKFQRIPALCCALLFFLYMVVFHVQPVAQSLQAVRDVLCEGQKDFAIGLNADTKLLYMAPTTAIKAGVMWPLGKPQEVAIVESLTKSVNLFDEDRVVAMREFTEMSDTSETTIEIFVEQRFVTCEDRLDNVPPFVLNALQRQNSNPSATTCQDFHDGCFNVSQHYVRLNCPATCGFTSPRSGQLLTSPSYGIDMQKCRETEQYRSELEEIPCSDLSQEESYAVTLHAWNRTWKQFVDLWGRFSQTHLECYQKVADVFLFKGCAALSIDSRDLLSCMEFPVLSLCAVHASDIPNLAMFCPIACGCNISNSSPCPPSCSRPSKN